MDRALADAQLRVAELADGVPMASTPLAAVSPVTTVTSSGSGSGEQTLSQLEEIRGLVEASARRQSSFFRSFGATSRRLVSSATSTTSVSASRPRENISMRPLGRSSDLVRAGVSAEVVGMPPTPPSMRSDNFRRNTTWLTTEEVPRRPSATSSDGETSWNPRESELRSQKAKLIKPRLPV